MWDLMPTILEDSSSQSSSQFGDELIGSMLDERDRLVASLKNEQEKVRDLEKERDSLQRQLNQNLPQVSVSLSETDWD